MHFVIPTSKRSSFKSVFRSTCVRHDTHTSLARWRVSSEKHYRICNLLIWQKMVVSVCLQVNESEIQLTLFHSSGTIKSFLYLSLPDIFWVPASEVLYEIGSRNCIWSHNQALHTVDTLTGNISQLNEKWILIFFALLMYYLCSLL